MALNDHHTAIAGNPLLIRLPEKRVGGDDVPLWYTAALPDGQPIHELYQASGAYKYLCSGGLELLNRYHADVGGGAIPHYELGRYRKLRLHCALNTRLTCEGEGAAAIGQRHGIGLHLRVRYL